MPSRPQTRRWTLPGVRALAALLVLGAALAGCAAPSAEKRLALYRTDVEAQERFIANLDRYDDPALTAYLETVLERLAAASGSGLADAALAGGGLPEVEVLDTSHANAYASDGHGVRITRGMLALLSDEAELAFVLGHELGHLHQASDMLGRVAFLAGLEKKLDPAALLSEALQRQEIDADRRATLMLEKAGYDGAAARRVILKFDALDGDGEDDGYIASHPVGAERIAALPSAPTGERHAERFRKRVDGMPFGGWRRFYFRDGARIRAPFLKLSLAMPDGFDIEEQDATFLTLADDRKDLTLVFSNAFGAGLGIERVLREEIHAGLDSGLDLGRVRDIRRFRSYRGGEAMIAVSTIIDTEPVFEVSFLLIAHRGDWLVGMMFHPARQRDAAQAVLTAFAESLEEASPTDTMRLRFRPWRAGASLEDLAAEFGEGADGMRLFLRTNDLKEGQNPAPGQLLKTVAKD